MFKGMTRLMRSRSFLAYVRCCPRCHPLVGSQRALPPAKRSARPRPAFMPREAAHLASYSASPQAVAVRLKPGLRQRARPARRPSRGRSRHAWTVEAAQAQSAARGLQPPKSDRAPRESIAGTSVFVVDPPDARPVGAARKSTTRHRAWERRRSGCEPAAHWLRNGLHPRGQALEAPVKKVV